jgi:hypothetical protein
MITGKISCNHSGTIFPYEIKVNFDLQCLHDMQTKWNKEKDKIFKQILEEEPEVRNNQELLFEACIKYQLVDFQWDWYRKALVLNSKNYVWFYLVADNSVQAACIIYHPKASKLDNENIFYIEYISTAYWNRTRPNFKKRFSGLGTLLISSAINYAITTLGYRPGFSLHSIPTAEPYYQNLGLQPLGKDTSKENLEYFEASEQVAISLLEDCHD